MVAVAGGPAFVAQEEVALTERLNLLLRAHRIHRIAIIAHDDCGYYKHRYPDASPDELRKRQREDLQAAANRLRQRGIQVRAFFAFVENGEVVFEEVPIEERR
nr:hypothetical protein [Ammonifex degensii]